MHSISVRSQNMKRLSPKQSHAFLKLGQFPYRRATPLKDLIQDSQMIWRESQWKALYTTQFPLGVTWPPWSSSKWRVKIHMATFPYGNWLRTRHGRGGMAPHEKGKWSQSLNKNTAHRVHLLSEKKKSSKNLMKINVNTGKPCVVHWGGREGAGCTWEWIPRAYSPD